MSTPNWIIRSHDRYQGSPQDFEIKIPGDFLNYKRYKILDVAIPNLIYNVDSSNSTLRYYDSQNRTITLNEGYYTTSSLLQAVADAMTAASGIAYTVVANSSTLLTTIAVGAGTFYLKLGPQSPLASVLGFHSVFDQNSATASSLTSSTACYLARDIEYALISISEMSNNQIMQTNNISGAFKVPILSASGQINYLTTELLFDQGLVSNSASLNSLHIQLLRPNGKPLRVLGDWFFTLAPM